MEIIKEKLRKMLVPITGFLYMSVPVITMAAPSFGGQIVPVCTSPTGCGYCDLMELAKKVIEFLVFLAIVIAILMIIYAGFLYVTGFGNASQISKAHSTLKVAIIGLILVLASYLIIELIVGALSVTGNPWTLPGCP